jgi:hypothetical protein
VDEDKGSPVSDRRSGDDAPSGQQAAGPMDLDFSTFVISLATSAQVGLGSVPHPETNRAAQNFPAAKQMIDILALLKEKTKGNLTDDESSLLDQVLHNLRIHYVRAREGQKESGG